MVAPRPVDRMGKPEGYMFTRLEALHRNVCCRCGQVPHMFDPADLSEYWISAMCPDCWKAVMGEEDNA